MTGGPRLAGHGLATGVLLLSGEGTVLARSGPPDLLGPSRNSGGHADLPAYFRSENGEDLLALVRAAANADGEGPLVARVLSQRSDSSPPILLTLHPVGPGLVVGVLADGSNVPSGAQYAVSALRMVWDGLAEGVAVAALDPEGHLEGIAACNCAFAAMFGLAPDDVIRQSLQSFLAPLNGAAFLERVEKEVAREGRPLSDLAMAQRGPASERTLVDWELAPVRAQDGRVLGVVAVVRDASQTQRAVHRRRSDVDPPSGLPNQVHFLSRLERSVERAAQARAYTFAVIGVEMQGLRAAERRLGTLVANTALEALVRRLEQRLRPSDLVARTGDRRLAILLDHFAPWGDLDEVLERIRLVTAAPYTIAGERMTMSAIAAPGPVWSGEGPPVSAQEVLSHLDAAVARVRDDGPSRGLPESEG